MENKGISGTLLVYGAAAEESEGAKVFMAREGLFDNCAAVPILEKSGFGADDFNDPGPPAMLEEQARVS